MAASTVTSRLAGASTAGRGRGTGLQQRTGLQKPAQSAPKEQEEPKSRLGQKTEETKTTGIRSGLKKTTDEPAASGLKRTSTLGTKPSFGGGLKKPELGKKETTP